MHEAFTQHGGILAFDHQSPLAPAAPTPFTYRNIQFDSVLRMAAYSRARHINDDGAAKRAMSAPDPGAALLQVGGLGAASDPTWNAKLAEVIKVAYREVLFQNPRLLRPLAGTAGRRVAFAHPDRRLGIGLDSASPLVGLPMNWTGLNLAGAAVEDLRDSYFREVMPIFLPVRMLDEHDKAVIAARCQDFVEKAKGIYHKPFRMPEVRFEVRGKVGGLACYGENWVDFNPVLAWENFDEFIIQVVPHEIAHMIAPAVWGERIRGHGKEWQAVMTAFGVPPDQFHCMPIANVQGRKKARMIVRCRCQLGLVDGKHSAHGLVCRLCEQRMVAVEEGQWVALATPKFA